MSALFNNRSVPLFLLFLAYVPTQGYFSYQGIFLLSIIILYYLYHIFHPVKSSIENQRLVSLMCLGLLLFSAITYQGIYRNIDARIMVKIIIFGLIGYLFISHFIKKKSSSLILILLIYIFTSIFVISNSPEPKIDVYFLLKEAPLALLAGLDPYALKYTQIYPGTTNEYGYLPVTLIYLLPFNLITNDPRYGVMFAHLISAYLLSRLLKKQSNVNLYVAGFLFMPQTFNILEFSYLEPIIILFLMLFLYYYKQKKSIAFLALGLFFSVKQNYLIYLPFMTINFLKYKIKPTIIYFLLPLSIFMGFFFFSTSMYRNTMPSFINKVLLPVLPHKYAIQAGDNLTPITKNTRYPPYFHALSMPAALRRAFSDLDISLINKIGVLLFIVSWILIWFLRLRLFEYLIMTTLVYNYFFYHSFMNNYYWLSQLIFLSILFQSCQISFTASRSQQ